MRQDRLTLINRRVYEHPRIVNYYRSLNEKPDDSEEFILDLIKCKINDAKILDIGVGGGRTTPILINFSKNYIGIDYSKPMIEASRKRFPQIDFTLCDVRNLDFEDNIFKFILFSYNGIDDLSHLDRLKALKEIFRVLEPGGFFLFSTHNLDFPLPSIYKFSSPNDEFRRSYVLMWPFLYLLRIWNHLRLRNKCFIKDDYAIINDSAHNYSMLTYYITTNRQFRQLAECGFINIKCFDLNRLQIEVNGKSITEWNYFLSTKPISTKKLK